MNNNIACKKQYDFQANLTADEHEVTDFIYNHIFKNHKCIDVFLALARTFDSVNHIMLLFKIERCGIKGLGLKLIGSYLSWRKQRTKIENTYSDFTNIIYLVECHKTMCWVPFLFY